MVNARGQHSGTEAERVFADVLCAVDGTRGSFAAVEQAAVLVGPGASLTLLAVTAVSGSGQYRTAAISPQRVDRVLTRAAELAHAAGVRTARIVDPGGPPAEVILQAAAERELLAIGAPAASPLGGILLDGVGRTALESFTVPLLAARPLRGQGDFLEHIVVASDGSDGSDRVVALAARISRAHASSVVLVHTVGAESQAHPHRIEQQARQLGLAGEDLRVEARGPREAILDVAITSGASLILMGSRRLGGLHALGSVSQHVVHGAPCSVLLVPPE